MASSWRFDVWTYGLTPCGASGATKFASRYLRDARLVLTNNQWPSTYPNYTGYLLPGVEFPDSYLPVPFPGGAGPYPHGFPVEPDVHV